MFKDNCCKREILALQIFCRNEGRGCAEQLALGHLLVSAARRPETPVPGQQGGAPKTMFAFIFQTQPSRRQAEPLGCQVLFLWHHRQKCQLVFDHPTVFRVERNLNWMLIIEGPFKPSPFYNHKIPCNFFFVTVIFNPGRIFELEQNKVLGG